MSEMLGNQYFLSRKYSRATGEYENCLQLDPKNKTIRRRLIVCYTQIGKISRALELFLELVAEDIDFVINTSIQDEDCPCPELVQNMEANISENTRSVDFHLILGMLWLYCDVAKANKYFKIARQFEDKQDVINIILNRIEKKMIDENVVDL